MSRPTVVVSPRELRQERIELDGEAFRHLFRARRLGAGAGLRLVDGRGAARWAEVDSVGRRRAGIALGDEAPPNEAPVAVELWVGVPRPRRAAWLVEKATEVGITALRWLDTAHSGRTVPEPALERHRRIAVAAVEQSSRALVPEISGLHPLSDLVAALEPKTPTLVLDRRAPTVPPGEAPDAAAWRRAGAVRVVVGPEGGLRAEEIEELESAGAKRLRLGERVLRVETAAVVAAGVVLWSVGGGAFSEL
ncbi:MAG: RsmE family RNA methyltransferase [Thermoanaerobaculia bacterium]|nr:RsmE family RNA methyltransferase [Thermoanaerobaculia bacterium]